MENYIKIFDYEDEKMKTFSQYKVLYYLKKQFLRNNGICTDSIETIAEQTNICRTTVILTLKYLVDNKLINVDKKIGSFNKYSIR